MKIAILVLDMVLPFAPLGIGMVLFWTGDMPSGLILMTLSLVWSSNNLKHLGHTIENLEIRREILKLEHDMLEFVDAFSKERPKEKKK